MTAPKAQQGHNTLPGTPARPGASTAPTRAILEDRYDGLMIEAASGDPSKLQSRLWRTLEALIEGTARRQMYPDGTQPPDAIDRLTAEVDAYVRERILEAIDKEGWAQ